VLGSRGRFEGPVVWGSGTGSKRPGAFRDCGVGVRRTWGMLGVMVWGTRGTRGT